MIKNTKMENPLQIINEIKILLQNNLIFCPSCNTHLMPNWMNLKDIAIVCGNQYCLFPLNSENMKLFTFNKENKSTALEQIFYYFQIKKEETKNSTSSNLSNYSSIEGNFSNNCNANGNGNGNAKPSRAEEVLDANKFQMNKTAQFIDTATNFESFGNFENFNNYNNDHDGDFFFMDNLR